MNPINYFYKYHPFVWLQTRISLKLRKEIFKHLPIYPGLSVLEVGTTPDMERVDSNYFSRQAKLLGCHVSVTSPENCLQMASKLGFNLIPFDRFLNGISSSERFDLVISSAVIEHVGNEIQKKEHLELLDRSSQKYIAIITPHRYHWVEFHTMLPFFHWLPKKIHRLFLRCVGMSRWADESHLDLLSLKEFVEINRQVFRNRKIRFKTFHFLGAISNLLAIVENESQTGLPITPK
ncbi:MAG: hypothetical protein ACKVQC_03885 [Elusimicrobiota bacterium]